MLNTKYIFDIETTGLNGIEDRITCISLLNVSTKELKSFCGESEIKILKDFWKEIEGAMEIIGYNIIFDIPFLLQRTLINNVPVCQNYSKIKKVDLRLISTLFFTCYNKAVKGTLDDWSKHLGMGDKKTSGEEMIEFYNQRNWEAIKEHCEGDCKITFELYLRLVNCGLIKY